MPRQRVWSGQEKEKLAIAYIAATNNSDVGADQRAPLFMAKVVVNFVRLTPIAAEPGRYRDRSASSVWAQLRDKFFPDIQRFNSSLRLVYISHPTGVTEQEKINMAIAIHLGRTKRMDYQFRNFHPES